MSGESYYGNDTVLPSIDDTHRTIPMIDFVYDPKATTVPVLRYLVAVAEHGHFGRAAQACGVAQPTLSAQIRDWEKRMGVVVFERDRRGARVTAEGKGLITAAQLL